MKYLIVAAVVGYLAGCGAAELGLQLGRRVAGVRAGVTEVTHYRVAR